MRLKNTKKGIYWCEWLQWLRNAYVRLKITKREYIGLNGCNGLEILTKVRSNYSISFFIEFEKNKKSQKWP